MVRKSIFPLGILLCVLFGVSRCAVPSQLLESYDPVADPQAIVLSGDGLARFTVLTDTLVRCERRPFSDAATMAAVNRRTPVPSFTSTATADGGVEIKTSRGVWRYKGQGNATSSSSSSSAGEDPAGPFPPGSLSAVVLKNGGADVRYPEWTNADPNAGSLLGTVRSLDQIEGSIKLNCTDLIPFRVHDESMHCAWGVLSAAGVASFDDTTGLLLAGDNGFPVARPGSDSGSTMEDVYVFAHGENFKAALASYNLVGGRAPVPPRAMHGAMFSRWFDLTAPLVRAHVAGFSSRSIPLDVYIIDMDWHTGLKPDGQIHDDWDGYSLALDKFPTRDIGHWLRSRGLLAGVNLHDASGVAPWEDAYKAFCAAVGFAGNGTVPFAIANETYALSLSDVVDGSIRERGLTLSWIDWQQGGTNGGCNGQSLNPTILLNHIRATSGIRRGDASRSQMLARWGGLGNHRYQMGFSGDVTHTWASLAFQPYFTATAANVLYGFWSHDIIGAHQDHELQTRWIQWGALASPAFRQHDAGAGAGGCADDSPPDCSEVTSWGDMPIVNFEANRAAIRARLARVPHLYTLSRELFDTGVSPVRAPYVEFPTEPTAFSAVGPDSNMTTVMLGADLSVTPIAGPSDPATGLAKWSRWVPPGAWIDTQWGTVHTGPKTETFSFALPEVPTLARSGAAFATSPRAAGGDARPWPPSPPDISAESYLDSGMACLSSGGGEVCAASLPLPLLGGAAVNPPVIGFEVFPAMGGSSSSSSSPNGGSLYEDDGASTAYATGISGASVRTVFTHALDSPAGGPQTIAAEIKPEGSTAEAYTFLPKVRAYEIVFVLAAPPSSVIADGEQAPHCEHAARRSPGPVTCWRWSAQRTALVITLAPLPNGNAVDPRSVKIEYAEGRDAYPEQLQGVMGAISRATLSKALLDADRTDSSKRDSLTALSTVGDVLAQAASKCGAGGDGGDGCVSFANVLDSLRPLWNTARGEVEKETGDKARMAKARALLDTYVWSGASGAGAAVTKRDVPEEERRGVAAATVVASKRRRTRI